MPVSAPLQLTIHPTPPSGEGAAGSFWSGEGPSFKDVLDILNPLQHIPLISNLYQSLTDDKPTTGAQLAGGALFGGPIGFAGALFNSIVESQSGKDISSHLLALVQGDAPVMAAQGKETDTSGFLSPNQRAAYNSYVQTQNLTA